MFTIVGRADLAEAELRAATASVDDGIGRYNDAAAPLDGVAPLGCFARTADGRIAGGAVGRRWGACAELQQLWVDDALRGSGIGSRLMDRFEADAASAGCMRVYLETFSFQAPAFYRRRGYCTLASIEGFPGGIVKYTMAKELGAGA